MTSPGTGAPRSRLLHNRDGVVVRRVDLTPDVVEVRLDFGPAGMSASAIYGAAAAYVALHDRLGLDFVPTSRLLTSYALLAEHLDTHAEETLVRAVLATQEHAARLLTEAQRHFYGTTETMETSGVDQLRAFKRGDFIGRGLGEAFTAYLAEAGVPI